MEVSYIEQILLSAIVEFAGCHDCFQINFSSHIVGISWVIISDKLSGFGESTFVNFRHLWGLGLTIEMVSYNGNKYIF